jgi:crossover junction endodeoxyribonuclease RuvC
MFSFGFSAGLVDGVLAGLGIPTTYVTPQSWKRAAGLTSDKSAVRLRAAQLFPDMAKHFARVKDDGRAEAALIARYGVTK